MTVQGILFWMLAIAGTLLVLGVLVLAHELGHFVTARLSGIKVLEFGIGFPPRAKVLHDDGETLYTLNYLPIGGFCRFEGEESDSDDPRSFGNAGLLKQALVLVAGVTMNVIVALLIFFVVAWAFSPAETVKADYLIPSGAAAKAGLHDGVTIESINGQRFGFLTSQGELLEAIRARAGETVTLGYVDTDGVRKTIQLTLGSNPQAGVLGITCEPIPHYAALVVRDVVSGVRVSLGGQALPRSGGCYMDVGVNTAITDPGTAAATAVDQTWTSLGLILGALGDLGSHLATDPTSAPPGVGGPVAITQAVGVTLLDSGPIILLLLAAMLSANLALINILPIPPFDGGKIVIQVIKRVFGVRGVSAYEIATNLIGFALLLVFMAWITFFDVGNLLGG